MRVFIDMDGVIVDFDKFRDDRGLTGDDVKAMQGAYLDMDPIPGAIEAVRSVIGMGYEVWLAPSRRPASRTRTATRPLGC